MLSVHILYVYRGRKCHHKIQVYFYNVFQAFSLKNETGKSQRATLHS